MAREIGWTVDMEGFNKALEQQKSRSRSAAVVDTEDWVTLIEGASNKFVGYDQLRHKAELSSTGRFRQK
jgi:alanyl-tRNA synthetase